MRSSLLCYVPILGLCLVVRLIVWLTYEPWRVDYTQRLTIGGDPKAYYHLAQNLYAGKGYRWLSQELLSEFPFWRWRYGEYEAIWTPGYPATLALVMCVTQSTDVSYLVIFQILCSTAACFVLMRSAELLQGARLGALVGLGFSLDPLLVNLSLVLLSESVFILCASLWVYTTSSIITAPSNQGLLPRIISNAVSVGLCIWLRVGTVALLPAIFVWAMWILYRRRLPIARLLQMGMLWLLLLYGILLPWYARNYLVYGQWRLSCISSFSLLAGLSFRQPSSQRYQEYRRLFESARSLAEAEGVNPDVLSPFGRARYWQAVAIQEYLSDSTAAIYAHLKRMTATIVFTDFANWRRFSGNDERSSLLVRGMWGWFVAWHVFYATALLWVIMRVLRRSFVEPLRCYVVGALGVSCVSIAVMINNAEPRGRLASVLICLPCTASLGLCWRQEQQQ